MNNSKIFVFVIAVLLVVAVLIELSVPKRFNWKTSFDHESEQPFGCKLFDSLAVKSMKNGYSVRRTTYYQLLKDSVNTPLSVIDIHDNYYEKPDLEIKSMLDFVARGNKVLIATHNFSDDLLDSLHLVMDEKFFYSYSFGHGLISSRETLLWDEDSMYDGKYYNVYSGIDGAAFKLGKDTMLSSYINDDMYPDTIYDYDDEEESAKQLGYTDVVIRETSEEWETMAWKSVENEIMPIVMKRKWGRGEIVVCSTPLMLTNYGIMDGENVGYVYRLLNSISDNPVIRLVDTEPEESHVSQSPMRFFLANPPLRWATYMALTTLLLFMFFTARRRQRAIPVIKKAENNQLEFTKLIGTLYYQEGVHGDLVRKKYMFFAEQLRREMQVDIDNDAEDTENFNTIARHTGMEVADVTARIKTIRNACRGNLPMTEEEMMMYVDYMNEMLYGI
ncbi:DUF4350 domain-containing protein [Prevotella sp. OH937_COT-195]|uniref:DUF4350 domain-containing protein n=1 Tax=Prevotella sp. OH937_COT-195 TaxID=2491051 RepID=UPI000F6510A6|nr:DUF4350 domain-containing protein [Prevotella sp. OH937_COT-195]RRD02925.1 DUF4350 domain-containing protein [Prevotella sp. OH937_COT-195]